MELDSIPYIQQMEEVGTFTSNTEVSLFQNHLIGSRTILTYSTRNKQISCICFGMKVLAQ